MPVYKLHYFNGRGRAEVIRLIFAAAGQKFEDIRIEFNDWPNKKKDYKYGKLPVLEVDNEKLHQSVAIMHYLALQFGLAGKTPMDAAKCHAAVETIRDLVLPLAEKLLREKDNAKRATILKQDVEPEVKKGLAALEEIAKAHMDKSGFMIGGQLTYADLAFQNGMFTMSEWLGIDAIKVYPTLYKHFEHVSNQPKVKEYLASRPKTMF